MLMKEQCWWAAFSPGVWMDSTGVGDDSGASPKLVPGVVPRFGAHPSHIIPLSGTVF